MRIVIVEDQQTARTVIRHALERAGYAVEAYEDGPTALARMVADPPALAILDVGLPGMDGLEVLGELRRRTDVPVIMLTAQDAELDRIVGLELGADDYITKPFSSRELAARVKAVLRRTSRRDQPFAEGGRRAGAAEAASSGNRMVFGPLAVDVAGRTVHVDGKPVELTRREFDLLVTLSRAPGRVFTRDQLLDAAWGSSAEWQLPSTVTEHVRRLRQKVEIDPGHPAWIQTVRGVGYRFVAGR